MLYWRLEINAYMEFLNPQVLKSDSDLIDGAYYIS